MGEKPLANDTWAAAGKGFSRGIEPSGVIDHLILMLHFQVLLKVNLHTTHFKEG
jgi:hypothetical protein